MSDDRVHMMLVLQHNDRVHRNNIVGYYDTDYTNDLNKCRSTISYMFTLTKAFS